MIKANFHEHICRFTFKSAPPAFTRFIYYYHDFRRRLAVLYLMKEMPAITRPQRRILLSYLHGIGQKLMISCWLRIINVLVW